ncbi:hypothetical protein KDAU_12550 [Dictyobacter aurantiacus]|uniref:Uncharacterized protein n=1 Tax=Dictyobacter aurantiacus TaxID=1936993 RepID=A0A401ZAT9_9CHLR|nr:hypothetical protein KDAU_12550 [Dictyobacter aurantiacus]
MPFIFFAKRKKGNKKNENASVDAGLAPESRGKLGIYGWASKSWGDGKPGQARHLRMGVQIVGGRKAGASPASTTICVVFLLRGG